MIVWSGVAAKWPAAHAMLKYLAMEAGGQRKLMPAVDGEDKDLGKLAKARIDRNSQVWQGWVEAAQPWQPESGPMRGRIRPAKARIDGQAARRLPVRNPKGTSRGLAVGASVVWLDDRISTEHA
jgi:hypothetical protein